MKPSYVLTQVGRSAAEAMRSYQQRLPRLPLDSGPGTGTVYYLTPDNDEPSGGMRVMYRHVDVLNEAGIPASVLHSRRRFRCTWFEHTTRVTDTTVTHPGMRDLLVLPEISAGLLPTLPDQRPHVIFNQGAHLTLSRDDPTTIVDHYRRAPNLLAVMTVSDHSADLLSRLFPEVEVRRVRLSVDAGIFHPDVLPPKRVITYMPRRNSADANLVLQMVASSGALEGWEIQQLEGLSQRQTAEALRKSMIFLHFTYQEGFGLPAAEAMACGNLVVGFHGFGAREFLRSRCSRPIPTGDVVGFAKSLEEILARESAEPGWCRGLGLQAAANVSAAYTPGLESADVVSFYRDISSSRSATSWTRPTRRPQQKWSDALGPIHPGQTEQPATFVR